MAKKTTEVQTSPKNIRYVELKQMLEARRAAIRAEVQGMVQGVRAEGRGNAKLADKVDSSGVDIQDEIEFALIKMKSVTLEKINSALERLDQEAYGNCFECGGEIAENRLRALPFAVRCTNCEEAKEVAEQRERQLAQRRGLGGLFS